MTKRALNSQMNTVGHCHTDLAEVKSSETRPLNINLTDTLFILQSVFKSTSRAALQERKLYRSTRPAETFFGYQREGIRSQSHQRYHPLFLARKLYLFFSFSLSRSCSGPAKSGQLVLSSRWLRPSWDPLQESHHHERAWPWQGTPRYASDFESPPPPPTPQQPCWRHHFLLDIADLLQSLAYLYTTQGKYEQAESLYERALNILELSFGKEHPSVAQNRNNLAWIFFKQAKYKEAEKLYKKSLRIREKTFGKVHPDVARYMSQFYLFFNHLIHFLPFPPFRSLHELAELYHKQVCTCVGLYFQIN